TTRTTARSPSRSPTSAGSRCPPRPRTMWAGCSSTSPRCGPSSARSPTPGSSPSASPPRSWRPPMCRSTHGCSPAPGSRSPSPPPAPPRRSSRRWSDEELRRLRRPRRGRLDPLPPVRRRPAGPGRAESVPDGAAALLPPPGAAGADAHLPGRDRGVLPRPAAVPPRRGEHRGAALRVARGGDDLAGGADGDQQAAQPRQVHRLPGDGRGRGERVLGLPHAVVRLVGDLRGPDRLLRLDHRPADHGAADPHGAGRLRRLQRPDGAARAHPDRVPGAGLGGGGAALGDLRRPQHRGGGAAADPARRRGAARARQAPAPVGGRRALRRGSRHPRHRPRRADDPCARRLLKMQDARPHVRCGSERPVGTHQLERRSMDRERHEDDRGGADWIFAAGDPHDLPTDRLPDRAEFDRYATPLLARRDAYPAMPPGENETVDLSSLDLEHPDADPAGGSGAEPAAATGAIPVLGPDGDPVPAEPDDEEALVAPLARPGAISYARSGTTPNAEDEDETPWNGFVLPDRFRELGVFD